MRTTLKLGHGGSEGGTRWTGEDHTESGTGVRGGGGGGGVRGRQGGQVRTTLKVGQVCVGGGRGGDKVDR